MKEIELIFKTEIIAHQSVRRGKGNFYQPSKIKDYKKSIAYQAISQLDLKFKMFTEIVFITELTFVFPVLKSMKKGDIKKIEEGELIYKTTKPDLTDNLQKAFIDALSGVVYKDDNIIAREDNVKKVYGFRPGIIFKLKGL